MKKIITKILLVFILISFCFIPNTNSSFLDLETSSNNIVTAGCWGAPDLPQKLTPTEIINNNNVNLSWTRTSNHCPNSLTYYRLQLFSDSNGQNQIYQTDWMTSNSYQYSNLVNGKYWWRIDIKDENGYSQSTQLWPLIVDKQLPVSVIDRPWNSNHDNEINFPIIWYWDGKIEGTAFDVLSGIDHVEISIFRQIVNRYWNGSNWVNGSEESIRVRAEGTTNWRYQVDPIYIPFGKFKIIAHAVDKAGNVENSATIEFENKELPSCSPELNFSTNYSRASFNLNCISQFNKLDYQLIYNSLGIEKGISGSSVLNNQDSFVQNNLILGSCSSLGEVCNFDPNISQLKLDVILTQSDGRIIKLSKFIP